MAGCIAGCMIHDPDFQAQQAWCCVLHAQCEFTMHALRSTINLGIHEIHAAVFLGYNDFSVATSA